MGLPFPREELVRKTSLMTFVNRMNMHHLSEPSSHGHVQMQWGPVALLTIAVSE